MIDIVFELEDYLIQNGWKKRNNVWLKGFKSLYFTKNSLMIALNNDRRMKHRHIVTCETPNDFFEADIIFKKCRLNSNLLQDDTENKH